MLENLHDIFDASLWAKQFIRMFGDRKDEIDEGLMLGWFSNAIMCGYDHARRESKDLEPSLTRVYE